MGSSETFRARFKVASYSVACICSVRVRVRVAGRKRTRRRDKVYKCLHTTRARVGNALACSPKSEITFSRTNFGEIEVWSPYLSATPTNSKDCVYTVLLPSHATCSTARTARYQSRDGQTCHLACAAMFDLTPWRAARRVNSQLHKRLSSRSCACGLCSCGCGVRQTSLLCCGSYSYTNE
ncbi:hypothetical protein J6590_001616 [Homalodisca vitripennis]|nr:hypothetical protein J6590_001616 [Homalodisca vitripennis]